MSGGAAVAPQPIHIPGGWFPFPNVIADKLVLLAPAERVYLVLAYRHGSEGRPAPVTDTMWVEKAGMTLEMRRHAVRGLAKKKWLPVAEDEAPAEVARTGRHDLRGFTGWARHADPQETRTEGRGPTKAPEPPEVHPECENGCALLSPAFATFVRKPVSASVQGDVDRGADAARNPGAGTAPSGGTGGSADGPTLDSDPEVKWAKTLAAMRVGFTSAGVELLMRLLTLLWSLADLKGVSDYVLAAAVRRAYAENRARMTGPGLLMNLVPAVLATWKAEGKRLDAASPAEPEVRALSVAAPYPREPDDAANPSAWLMIRRRLKTRITDQDYVNWVARTEFGRFESGTLLVWVPDAVTVEWFDQEYRGMVAEIVRQLELPVERVIFRMPRAEDVGS